MQDQTLLLDPTGGRDARCAIECQQPEIAERKPHIEERNTKRATNHLHHLQTSPGHHSLHDLNWATPAPAPAGTAHKQGIEQRKALSDTYSLTALLDPRSFIRHHMPAALMV
jgi:hypothetical protein